MTEIAAKQKLSTFGDAERLVWVDVETTGLDIRTSQILEVGLVVTTPPPELQAINEISMLVQPMPGWSEAAVWDHHLSAGGLFEQAKASGWPNLETLGHYLRGWLDGALDGTEYMPGPMCGSSVQFDRAILERTMAWFVEDVWTYRNFDVSTLLELSCRLFTRGATVSAVANAVHDAGGKINQHRALPDLHYAIGITRELCKLFNPPPENEKAHDE